MFMICRRFLETDLRADFLRKHGTRTILATPLLREGMPIGVIMIRRMEVRPFSDRQIASTRNFRRLKL